MRQCDAIIRDDAVVCTEWDRCTKPATVRSPGPSFDVHVCDEHKYWVIQNSPRAKFISIEDK